MQGFETIEDVTAWLEPLGYEAFWSEVQAQGLLDQDDRRHCDETLGNGIADFETVLTVMKGIARDVLVERHGLRYSTTIAPEPKLRIVH